MWGKVDGLLRNVSSLFERVDGERSNCPRCKGSGLLIRPTCWHWSQSPSNVPCWFCEGVGVMPIVGLNGFIVARAPSMLQIQDTKPHPRLPIQMQLYLGKFPGTRCKFNTYKPCKEPLELVHDVSRVPAWLTGDSIAGHSIIPIKSRGTSSPAPVKYKKALKSHLQKKYLKPGLHSSNNPPPLISTIFGEKQQHTSFSEGLDHKASIVGSSQALQKSRFWTMEGSLGNQKKSPKAMINFLTHKKLDNKRGQPYLTRCKTCKALMQQDTYFATSHVCHLHKSAALGTTHATQQTGVINGTCGSEESRSQGTFLVATLPRPERPLLSTPKKSRSSRRERNRVREKAVREAAERAQRIQRPSVPIIKEPTLIVAGHKKENIRWLGNQNWKQALSSIFGDRSLLKSFNSSQSSIPAQTSLPENIWTIQNIYSRIKEHNLFSPPPLLKS